jgi:hypothetical protein
MYFILSEFANEATKDKQWGLFTPWSQATGHDGRYGCLPFLLFPGINDIIPPMLIRSEVLAAKDT